LVNDDINKQEDVATTDNEQQQSEDEQVYLFVCLYVIEKIV